MVKYRSFTKASHRNVWSVRVLFDTEIDNAAYIPNHGREKTFLLIQKPPDRLWGSPSLLFTGTGDLSLGLIGQGVKLTAHLHLVWRLIMSKTANIATPATCPYDGRTATSLTSYTSKFGFSCFLVIVMTVFIFLLYAYVPTKLHLNLLN